MKLNIISLTAILVGAVALSACTDASQSKWNALSQPHVIKQFSGGQLVGQWESTGSVQNEDHSDGYYFEDAATHKLVTVSGSVQVTVK
jgi:hypothetical protein